MPLPGEMTLDDLRIRVRRLLNVPDTATGQWSDARLTQEVNLAATWLQQRLLTFQMYWDTVTTGPVAVSSASGEFPQPDDFLVERRFQKRISTAPERWEFIELVDEQNVDGGQQGGQAREKWLRRAGKFKYLGANFAGGTYELVYMRRIAALALDDDVPQIPPQWHHVIALKAACVCSLEVTEPRYEPLVAELERAEKAIDAESARFQALRQPELALKELPFGTYGYVRENVKAALAASGKRPPDYWNEARLSNAVNNALNELQIDLMGLNRDIFTRRIQIECAGGLIKIPANAITVRKLCRLVNGDELPQAIVPSAESWQYVVAGPSYDTDGSQTTVGRPVWHVEGGPGELTLRTQAGWDVDGTYILYFEPLLPRLEHDTQPIGIPLEHTNALIAKAVARAMSGVGEVDMAQVAIADYAAQLSGARGRIAQGKVSKRHRIRDTHGYGLDDLGGAPEWY